MQGQPVNNIVVTAREVTRALNERHVSEARGGPARALAYARGRLELVRVESVIAALQVLSWVTWAMQCVGLRRRDTGTDEPSTGAILA